MKVPGVLRRTVQGVGVDFGSSAVKAVALSADGERPSLVGADREPLDPGLVADGVVRNPDTVGAALARLLARIGVRAPSLSVGMGGSSVFVKRLPAPVAAPDTATPFRELVAEEAARHLPFHIESVEYDYERDPAPDGADGPTPPGIVFGAAPKDIVRAHCDAVHRAGYRIARIDLEPYALFGAAQLEAAAGEAVAPASLAAGPTAFVEIGARRIGVHLFRRGARRREDEGRGFPLLRRRAPGELLASVAVPGIGAEAVHAAPTAIGAEAGPDVDGVPGRDVTAATIAFRIVAALQEALNEAGLAPPVAVRLSGGGARLSGVADAVDRFAAGPAVVLDPLEAMGATTAGPDFAVAAGLALHELPDLSIVSGGAE